MRVFWAGFLTLGLILVGLTVYDRVTAPTQPSAPGFTTCEDGTPMPQPTPKPTLR